MPIPMNGAVWVVMSDIHGNLQALEAVKKDARREAKAIGYPSRKLCYISLGDVVDYGPEPTACLQWVQKKCVVKLRGNHDLEASRHHTALPDLGRVQSKFWPVTVWTRCQLTEDERNSLYEWPTLCEVSELPGFLLAHVDLRGNVDQSRHCEIKPNHASMVYKDFFIPLIEHGSKYGLIGHSHKQVIFQSTSEGHCSLWCEDRLFSEDGKENGWAPLPEGRLLINPGGLGQPRCRDDPGCLPPDPRAQYLLLDTRGSTIRYKFRRVEYAKEETAKRLKQIEVPKEFAPCKPRSGDSPAELNARQIARLYADWEQTTLNFLVDQILRADA